MQSLHNTKLPFQLRYLVMPDYIYSDNRLTDVSRRLYSFINTYKNPFYFTNDQIAEMFNCSVRAVEDAVALLKKVKLIETKHRNKSGGGKTRLIQTTEIGGLDIQTTEIGGLEPQSTVVSEDEVEGANHGKGGRKDIKDNILKGKNLEELSKLPIEEIRKLPAKTRKEVLDFIKRNERGWGNQYQGGNLHKPSSFYKDKKPMKGVDATDL